MDEPALFPVSPERTGASLAVRYRPRRFAEVVGQQHVTAVLGRAISTQRLPQQILFSGGSGLGKTTLARVTAAALLCETPLDKRSNGDACGLCGNCIDITTPGHSHPDVIEFDAASHGGKDEIKLIADRAQLSPLRARRKVYIIDEAHGLSGPGGQAFLKLLEEPPTHVTFMLATTDPQKMLKTNRGRCTEFELTTPSVSDLTANIVRVAEGEGWDVTSETARAIVEASDRSLGVRATLMSLEKLAGLLDEGEPVTPTNVALLLGSAAPSGVAKMVNALESYDASASFAALADARLSSSDAALRSALVEWARRALLESGPGDFEVARWRLATVLEAPSSPGWLELVVARLVSPPLTADSLLALSAEAAKQITTLTELLAQSKTLPGTPEPEQEPIHATPTEQESPEVETSGQPPVTPTRFSGDIPTELIRRVGLVAPKAAALLRASTLSVDGDALKVVTSAANVGPLRDHADAVRSVAGELGVTLLLAVSA